MPLYTVEMSSNMSHRLAFVTRRSSDSTVGTIPMQLIDAEIDRLGEKVTSIIHPRFARLAVVCSSKGSVRLLLIPSLTLRQRFL